MARRRRSRSGNPAGTLIAALAGVALLAGGFFAVKQIAGDGTDAAFKGLTRLEVQEFLDNAKSLQGNVYQLEGQIDDQLAWAPGSGRVFSVDAAGTPVGVKVPETFSNHNIQRGQNFLFKVRVAEGGFLVVEALKKI